MPQMNRREFVASSAVAAVALTVLGSIDAARADDQPPATPPSTAPAIVDVGPLASYSADGFTDTWIKTNKFAVVRDNGKVYAMTAICTHKGCLLRVETNHLFCKCHKGVYGLDGVPTRKPPIHPLNRFAISLDNNNHLIVDMSQTFDPDHWTDPASFVPAN